ncbi:OsmC family protein [Levilactobacillus acidifarinae]|uniref:OsmC family protein n=1 Tax=Levilactobacillus acidifarinae DSM 19394 = JCM 15949 TaxID=1423715 RepID=A0A0R1LLN2_9LACO|nr:OsmC family protein [Levilactobacillus acidifarinae]KRK96757.1 hypothetical protein FD25_GL001682 [Levilactobacillus acidifarinae DSM 19394]GEO69877.1 hypothetical protein LAC03_17870 [Levilactobacillus acidifarinae]
MTLETFKATVTSTATPNLYQASVRDFMLSFSPNSTTAISPLEGILASLGACESIVMASFHEREKFSYRSVYFTLEGQEEDTDRPGLNRILVSVHYDTDETRQASHDFMEFAEGTCPVMDNLTNAVPITRMEVTTETSNQETIKS